MADPRAVGVVTLWREGPSSNEPERWRSYKVDDYQEEYRALPAAAHDAREEDVRRLREALEFIAPLLTLLPDELGASRLAREKAQAALRGGGA